jgi:hypothetical protein
VYASPVFSEIINTFLNSRISSGNADNVEMFAAGPP